MIIRRELAIDVPAYHGTVTLTPEQDNRTATYGAQRHVVAIHQDGETVRLEERGEVAELIEALQQALELFPAQREATRRPHADTPPAAREAMAAAGLWADGALAQNRRILESRPLSADVARNARA